MILSDWNIEQLMKFHFNKCKVMHMGKTQSQLCTQRDGDKLEMRYCQLGVIVDNSLKTGKTEKPVKPFCQILGARAILQELRNSATNRLCEAGVTKSTCRFNLIDAKPSKESSGITVHILGKHLSILNSCLTCLGNSG